MRALERLLSGREERAMVQGRLLSRYRTVVQVSLNIPGLPKAIEGDRMLVSLVAGLLMRSIGTSGSNAGTSILLENGAGCSEIFGVGYPDPVAVKVEGVNIENKPWGAVLDIDVMTPEGVLHRRSLYGTERRCLLCENPAKTCARMNLHSYEELRRVSKDLIKRGLKELNNR